MCELVVAVEHLHGRGVLWRDLRPESVGVDEDGHLKVVECGAAKMVGNHSTSPFSTDFIGTPPYLAPEMLTNIFPHGKAADYYCLGVMLYEFLHGKAPFSA
jgi:serum/glucocorticoid-regulated kinase 2